MNGKNVNFFKTFNAQVSLSFLSRVTRRAKFLDVDLTWKSSRTKHFDFFQLSTCLLPNSKKNLYPSLKKTRFSFINLYVFKSTNNDWTTCLHIHGLVES